jgi:hypothetical protein
MTDIVDGINKDLILAKISQKLTDRVTRVIEDFHEDNNLDGSQFFHALSNTLARHLMILSNACTSIEDGDPIGIIDEICEHAKSLVLESRRLHKEESDD